MSASDYKATIGLEIHAHLNTATKMFCNSRNVPDEKKANVHVCPVCMGHPGTLPVINREAIRSVLRVGHAVSGAPATYSEFDRKNYFYPDIPKGYQISQYAHPLVRGGTLDGVLLTRIHLEEDTARTIHDGSGQSFVDFNRSGIPLMELVTEPVIDSGERAAHFARELQMLLRYLGVAKANMEKGEMRIEANVSVGKNDARGVKVEVKNLNSFKSVERAITYEIERQIALLEAGDVVVLSTRGWDDERERTVEQRIKETSEDYRYFPDPDLPKVIVSDIPAFSSDEIRELQPELPWDRRERLARSYGIKTSDIELFVERPDIGDYFERVAKCIDNSSSYQLAANYISSDLVGHLGRGHAEIDTVEPERMAALMELIDTGILSSRGGKDVLKELMSSKDEPRTVARRLGIEQESDESVLAALAQSVIEMEPNVAKDFAEGKEVALGFLMGKGIRVSGNKANPKVLEKVLRKLLGEKR